MDDIQNKKIRDYLFGGFCLLPTSRHSCKLLLQTSTRHHSFYSFSRFLNLRFWGLSIMLPLPHQQARRRRRPASLLAGVLFACCLLSSALTASAFYVSSVQGHRIVLPRAQLHHRAQLYHPIVGAPADISLEKTERFPMLFGRCSS